MDKKMMLGLVMLGLLSFPVVAQQTNSKTTLTQTQRREAQTHLTQSQILMARDNDLYGAQDELNMALEIAPQEPILYLSLATVFYNMHETDSAITNLRIAQNCFENKVSLIKQMPWRRKLKILLSGNIDGLVGLRHPSKTHHFQLPKPSDQRFELHIRFDETESFDRYFAGLMNKARSNRI